MAKVLYGTSVSGTGRGGFPELKVLNMVPESEATEENQLVLNSRPGVRETGMNLGAGPVRALYQIDGVLDNSLFGISGRSLYQNGNFLGSIDGTGPAYLAGYETFLFANSGKSLWGYDGVSLSKIAFPDNADILAIAVGASRVAAIKKDTGVFYWSSPLGTEIDALDFATAENSPDKLKDLLFLGDTLILFGSETVEFWPVTQDPEVPFQPLQGRVFNKGIRETGCAAKFMNGFAWVSDTNEVLFQESTNIISTPTIESRIEQSSNCSLWAFTLFQSQYLALTLDDHTYVFSSKYGEWVEFNSHEHDNWLPRCATKQYLGSSVNGALYEWSDDHCDLGEPVVREASFWVPLDGGTVPVYNFALRTPTGTTEWRSGEFSEPSVEMRMSKDGGFNWSSWRERPLNTMGSFGNKVTFRSLGSFTYPGGLIEVRCSHPVPFRISGAYVNEVR